MDRLAAIADWIETLALCGADADRLTVEIATTAHAWRQQTEAEIERLGIALAALSVRHQSERDRALGQGMAAEGVRQAEIAMALARARAGLSTGGGGCDAA